MAFTTDPLQPPKVKNSPIRKVEPSPSTTFETNPNIKPNPWKPSKHNYKNEFGEDIANPSGIPFDKETLNIIPEESGAAKTNVEKGYGKNIFGETLTWGGEGVYGEKRLIPLNFKSSRQDQPNLAQTTVTRTSQQTPITPTQPPTIQTSTVNEFGEKLGADGKPLGYETPITQKAPTEAKKATTVSLGPKKKKDDIALPEEEPTGPAVGVNEFGEQIDANGNPTTIPPTTTDDNFQNLTNLVNDFANGNINDQVFTKALNQGIANLALYNQAQLEGIEQRVASDPNLKGTGLGYALIHMAARESGFNTSDLINRLTVDSMERLMDMQKFGINKAIQLDKIRRGRENEDLNMLIGNGQYDAAAGIMNGRLAEQFPGMGITINPDDLAARDPHTLQQFNSQMDIVSNIAQTSPEAALGVLQGLMDNPLYADWFPEGADPADMIESFRSGQFLKNIETNQIIQQEINMSALSEEGFNEVRGFYDQLDNLGIRNFTKEGEDLTLEEINEMRAAEKLVPYTDTDYQTLTDEDFKELGMQKDYYDKVQDADQNLYDATIEFLKNDPYVSDFLANDPTGEGMDALKKYVSKMLTPGNYTIDPDTGLPVPKGDLNAPWFNEADYDVFYTWPLANFDENGNIVGDFYLGAEVKVQEDPDDDRLDKAYKLYRNTGGDLPPQQWYFATSGGTREPDETKIPDAEFEFGTPEETGIELEAEEDIKLEEGSEIQTSVTETAQEPFDTEQTYAPFEMVAGKAKIKDEAKDMPEGSTWTNTLTGETWTKTDKTKTGWEKGPVNINLQTKSKINDIINNKNDLSVLNKSNWEEVLLNPDWLASLEQSGLKIKTLTTGDVFRAGDAKNSGLIFPKTRNTTHYNRAFVDVGKESEVGTIPDLEGTEGTIILHNDTPYQLSRYQTALSRNNSGDFRETNVYAINLLTGEEELIVETGQTKA